MKDTPLVNLALALFVTLAVGWLLIVGKPIILPVITALIAVYLIQSASNALQRFPLVRSLPQSLLRFILLSVFSVIILTIGLMTAATVRELANRVPQYQVNLENMLVGLADRFDLDRDTIWDDLRATVLDMFDLQDLFLGLLSGFTHVGASLFLVALYAAFLMSERATFRSKVAAAFRDTDQSAKVLQVVHSINSKISEYLAIKTLINLVLAIASFVVLWVHSVDFALFWALVIGLLNYIPYVGSYIGVFFPVVLSLAQFASLPVTLSLSVFLILAQVIVGNILEPRLVGRQVNLSPTVVLIALSVWTALWGVPGAILAVPMTSVLVIVFANVEATKFLAVLLEDKVEP